MGWFSSKKKENESRQDGDSFSSVFSSFSDSGKGSPTSTTTETFQYWKNSVQNNEEIKEYEVWAKGVWKEWKEKDSNLAILLFGCSLLSLGAGYRLGRRVRPFWQPLTNLQDLSSADIGTNQWWRGKVVSVSDGDTIRFVHRPTWMSSVDYTDKNNRLNIRLCTIDTPETAKFGNPGQKFGEEAKQTLKELCENKIVDITVLQMDQYGRAVAEVRRPSFVPFLHTYLDEAMLKKGMAEVYQGSGAVYGRLGKEKYLAIMEKAKKKKIGIWSTPDRETAADYKKRTKQ